MISVEAVGPLPMGLQDWADTLSLGWTNQRNIKSAADKGKAKEFLIQPKPSEPPEPPAAAEAESSLVGVKREEEDPSGALMDDDKTEAQIPPSDLNLIGFTPINRDSRTSAKLLDPAESDTEDEDRHIASLALVAIHSGTNAQASDADEPAVISERRPA